VKKCEDEVTENNEKVLFCFWSLLHAAIRAWAYCLKILQQASTGPGNFAKIRRNGNRWNAGVLEDE